jgi:hypothetical protein
MKQRQNSERRRGTSLSVVRRSAAMAAVFGLLVLAPEARVHAMGISAPPPPMRGAPELDPSLLSSGLVILAGGALLLMERRRQR